MPPGSGSGNCQSSSASPANAFGSKTTVRIRRMLFPAKTGQDRRSRERTVKGRPTDDRSPPQDGVARLCANALSIDAGAPWPINGSTCSRKSAPKPCSAKAAFSARVRSSDRINQSARRDRKEAPASLGGLLPGVGEQSLDELVFE
jgi:hypothetical protein